MLKKPYCAPKMEVHSIAMEECLATGSAKVSVLDTEIYEIEDEWEKETLPKEVIW